MNVRLAHIPLALAPLVPLAFQETAAPDHTEPARPGLVDWHDSFDAACAAARDSGKPVLLFQLFGRLDEEHC